MLLAVALAGSSLVALTKPAAGGVQSSGPQEICNPNADFALGAEDYAEAIRLHQEILRRDPSNALAHYHLGFAYGMTGDSAGELREYRIAQDLGLRLWDFFLNLGLAYEDSDQLGPAIEMLKIATALGPLRAEAHFDLGLAYERAGLLPAALRELSDAVRLDPTEPDAQNSLAVVYAELGDYRRARERLAKLVQIEPDYETARKNLTIVDGILAQDSLSAGLTMSERSSESSR